MTKVTKVKNKNLTQNTIEAEGEIVEMKKKKKNTKGKKRPQPDETQTEDIVPQENEVTEMTEATDGMEVENEQQDEKKSRPKRKRLTPIEKTIVEEQNKHGENEQSFRKTPFERLIREILLDKFCDENGQTKRLSKDAIVALQHATEQFLLSGFVSAKDIKDIVTPKIQTLDASHFLMAIKLSGQENVTHFCNDRISKFNIHRQKQTDLRKAQIKERIARLKANGGKPALTVISKKPRAPRKQKAPKKKVSTPHQEDTEAVQNEETVDQETVEAETNNEGAEEAIGEDLPQPTQDYVEAE